LNIAAVFKHIALANGTLKQRNKYTERYIKEINTDQNHGIGSHTGIIIVKIIEKQQL